MSDLESRLRSYIAPDDDSEDHAEIRALMLEAADELSAQDRIIDGLCRAGRATADGMRDLRVALDPQGGGIGWSDEQTVAKANAEIRDLREVNRQLSRFKCDVCDAAGVGHADRFGNEHAAVARIREWRGASPPRGRCGMRYHHADCPCDGAGGER